MAAPGLVFAVGRIPVQSTRTGALALPLPASSPVVLPPASRPPSPSCPERQIASLSGPELKRRLCHRGACPA